VNLLVRLLLSVGIALAVLWLVFVVALLLLRPKHVDLRSSLRFIPDLIRLLRRIAADQELARGVRMRLWLLLAYLAIPFDLIPDFIPLLGYADDVIIVSLVLRSVVRRTDSAVLDRYWTGSPDGLAVIRRLAGLKS
jgi:uncharacterized membrane protein YkvA (DUF1232 family)